MASIKIDGVRDNLATYLSILTIIGGTSGPAIYVLLGTREKEKTEESAA